MSIKKALLNGYVRTCRLLRGIDRNKVLFVSFGGKSYSDNPKAVSEALHEIAPELDILWLFQNPESKKGVVPDYVRVASAKSLKQYYREIATCAVMVNNYSFPEIPKGKQLFIQTWHGDRAFKKVLYDSPFVSERFRVSEARDGYCDLAVAGSDYGERQFRSAFHYTGTVLKIGTPRDDLLISPPQSRISAIKRQLGIPETTNALLYAPTLRRKNQHDGTAQQIQEIDIERTLDSLEQTSGARWVCLMRSHPVVAGLGGYARSSKILDVSSYEDMADLLLISDLLITDYSSSAGDYALLGRPIILFQSDVKEYVEQDRSFYFEMEDSPYYIAHNQAELDDLIQALSRIDFSRNCREILTFYGTNETGRAARTVAELIRDYTQNQGEKADAIRRAVSAEAHRERL